MSRARHRAGTRSPQPAGQDAVDVAITGQAEGCGPLQLEILSRALAWHDLADRAEAAAAPICQDCGCLLSKHRQTVTDGLVCPITPDDLIRNGATEALVKKALSGQLMSDLEKAILKQARERAERENVPSTMTSAEKLAIARFVFPGIRAHASKRHRHSAREIIRPCWLAAGCTGFNASWQASFCLFCGAIVEARTIHLLGARWYRRWVKTHRHRDSRG